MIQAASILATNNEIYTETLLKLPDSLLHFLLHRLVRVHDRLLVDNDLRGVCPRTAHSRRDRRWVRLDNDPVGGHKSPSSAQRAKGKKKEREKSSNNERQHVPVVYRLVQAENDAVQVLQHGPLLDLVSQEQVYRIHERGQRRVQHELVLQRSSQHVEYEVQRVLVHR